MRFFIRSRAWGLYLRRVDRHILWVWNQAEHVILYEPSFILYSHIRSTGRTCYCLWTIVRLIKSYQINSRTCYCLWTNVCLKGIIHGRFFIYIKLGILSLCTEPWHGTRRLLPVLEGHLMDRLCIQILIVNTQSLFNYIKSNFKLFTNPYTC